MALFCWFCRKSLCFGPFFMAPIFPLIQLLKRVFGYIWWSGLNRHQLCSKF